MQFIAIYNKIKNSGDYIMNENQIPLKVVILAAGRGERLNSDKAQIPKHMREVAGKPLLYYILKAVDFIENKNDIIIIVGYLKEKIINTFPEYAFVIQGEHLGYGTGAAVRYAEETIGDYSGDILVLLGDTPLITQESILNMYNEHKKNNNDCTLLSCEIDETLSIGRIVRDENGKFCGIVENRDCSDEQRAKIKEYNASVMLFNSKKFFEQAACLNNNNNSNEYYLTDVPGLFLKNNYKVGVFKSANANEIHGVNSMEELALVESILLSTSTK